MTYRKLANWYCSHDSWFDFEDFVMTEVHERGNYELEEVEKWAEKYGITKDTRLTWVSPEKWRANRYNLDADEWDSADQIPEDAMQVTEYTDADGFIIPESDDGDDGFLFVLRN